MRRLLAIAVSLAALAAVAFFLLRDRPSDVGSADPAAAAWKKKTPPPVLAAGGRTEDGNGSTSDVTSAAMDDKPVLPRYRGPLHVHGRVIAPDGTSFPATSTVHLVVVDGDAPSKTVIADAPLDGFGAFHFRAKPDFAVSMVRVVAAIPGFITATADAAPAADGDVAVDVLLADELKSGWTCRARVVDGDGKPVVGLPVAVGACGDDGSVVRLDWLNPSDVIGAGETGVAKGLRGTSITDADGRFVVRGLRSGGCTRAMSASPDWVILNDSESRSLAPKEQGDLTLHAARAVVLDLSIVDDADGKPVDECTVRSVRAGGAPVEVAVRGGRLRGAWASESPKGGSPMLDVAVQAHGFSPASATIASGLPSTIRLRRLGDDERGRLLVRLTGNVPQEVALEMKRESPRLDLRRPGRRSLAWVVYGTVEEDGVHFESLPEGSWVYEFWIPEAEFEALSQRGSITIARGAAAEIDWRIPPFGNLGTGGMAWGASKGEDVVFLLRSADGVEVRSLPRNRRDIFLPVGTWSLKLVTAGDRVLGQRDDIPIFEGKKSYVKLDAIDSSELWIDGVKQSR